MQLYLVHEVWIVSLYETIPGLNLGDCRKIRISQDKQMTILAHIKAAKIVIYYSYCSRL